MSCRPEAIGGPGGRGGVNTADSVMSKARILIVDDEPGVRSALGGVLRDEGYDVDAVASGEECLERATRLAPDVILLDIWLPGIDGLVTLARLR